MSVGSLARPRLTPSGWRCRLAVGVTDVLVGWRWQPASGIGEQPDVMRLNEPFVSWLRT